MFSFPGLLLRALLAAARRFVDSNGFVLCSHVAMSLMLALFPFILFVVAMAGALSRDVDADALIELIFGGWPEDIAKPISREIRSVLEASGLQLMTFGGVLALWFASNGVDAVRIALSRAYRDSDPRPFWKTRALSLLFVLLGGSAILLGVTVSFALPAYFQFFAQAIPDPLAAWLENTALHWLVTLAALFFAVGACHVWLPGVRHGIAEIWPGVLLTVALWIAAARGFALYIAYFADYSATYAGLAGAMAALIFLYLLAAILILGAEFNGALNRLRQRQTG